MGEVEKLVEDLFTQDLKIAFIVNQIEYFISSNLIHISILYLI